MARLEWEFDHPPKVVWDACLDADQWPVGAEEFQPVPGTRFTSGSIPAMDTEYVGRLECEVAEVIEHERMVVHISAPKHSGCRTRWELRAQLAISADHGTSVVTDIYGVDTEDSHERILLNLVGSLIRWILGHAGRALDGLDGQTKIPTIQ